MASLAVAVHVSCSVCLALCRGVGRQKYIPSACPQGAYSFQEFINSLVLNRGLDISRKYIRRVTLGVTNDLPGLEYVTQGSTKRHSLGRYNVTFRI